jgi:hypothetical protein
MTKTLTLLALGLAAVVLTGCGTSDDMPTAPRYAAPADLAGLQEYAAIGNSLTAGYQSGAWGNPEHVAASFPNLIARQLGIAGFKQVGMTGTGLGFVSGSPVGNMVVNMGASGPALSYTAADAANVAAMMAGAPADFDFSAPRNFGIPGITLMHSAGAPLSVYATGNPYAAFYTNAASAAKTQLQLAAEAGAGFITCWLGNNDVLGFVTSGGTGAITPQATFQASLNGVAALLGSTPYLAVMNIPSVTDIPFVTYANTVIIATLDRLNHPHAVYAVVDGATTVLPIDPGTGNYVLLPAASAMAADPTLGALPTNPLPDAYVLDAAELAAAQAAVESFNGMLAAMVDGLNAANRDHHAILVDMNAFFSEVVDNGYSYAGETFTTRFVTGGIFSLDGVHPTSLGYAIVANHILEAMGEHWELDLEPVDLAEFIGVNNGLGSWNGPVAVPDFHAVVELFQH